MNCTSAKDQRLIYCEMLGGVDIEKKRIKDQDNYAKFSKNFQEVTSFPHQEKKKRKKKK